MQRRFSMPFIGVGLLTLSVLGGCAHYPTSGNPHALHGVDAQHIGALQPVDGVARAIRGKTVIIVQPWIGLDRYELRELPVYFRSDGTADTADWIAADWSVRGNELCLDQRRTCYLALEDSRGQAYVRHAESGLLGRVTSIRPGDPLRLRAQYEAEQERRRQRRAQQQEAMRFFGELLMAAVAGGGSYEADGYSAGSGTGQFIYNQCRSYGKMC